MKLELQEILINNDLSEETTCFSAFLYVDGMKAGYCYNEGRGGQTNVTFLGDNNSDIAKTVYNYCNENPVIHTFQNETYTYHDVETRVDELLFEYMMQKELHEKQTDHLVLHKPKEKDPTYVIHAIQKLPADVNVLMKFEVGRAKIANLIAKNRKKGFIVMNTNINMSELPL